MFSYRHAFHAGNHADVLKHTTLIALMKYLTQKDTALTVIDTHAGRGLYDLSGAESQRSGEAQAGIARGLEAEQRLVPMVHAEDALAGGIAHSIPWLFGCLNSPTYVIRNRAISMRQ